MKVHELIKHLEGHDPNLEVRFRTLDNDYDFYDAEPIVEYDDHRMVFCSNEEVRREPWE